MLDVAIQAAKAGAEALLKYHASLRRDQIALKGPNDFVTEADRESERRVSDILRRAFPDHAITGEEGGASEGSAEYRWIIDPLDGTVNFAHGYPAFCVSIACEADGVLEYGVIYDPLRDELFEGVRGGGATLNGRPIRVSATGRLERALIATGFPYDIRERIPATMARLSRIVAIAQGLRRAGSAALDMCYVACGRLDGYFEENLKPWDTAAGLVILTEAGGRITTFDGGAYDIYAPNIAASNELLHQNMLEQL